VVLHVPHDAQDIPADLRDQFVVDDAALQAELDRMTDHHTLALFAGEGAGCRIVRAPVSRLVVDCERFANDAQEAMAARGMGAVYMRQSDGSPLRRDLLPGEREALLQRFYHPHHAALEAEVQAALERHGRCLVLDCHSFPDQPLPYEDAAPGAFRPEICIGTDPFHTDERLRDAFVQACEQQGWSVCVDDPFAGAIVPASTYRRDRRVAAVMVELNRRLYLLEDVTTISNEFEEFGGRVRALCAAAIAGWVKET
jgi:N-formylglutamate amidohydrolase